MGATWAAETCSPYADVNPSICIIRQPGQERRQKVVVTTLTMCFTRCAQISAKPKIETYAYCEQSSPPRIIYATHLTAGGVDLDNCNSIRAMQNCACCTCIRRERYDLGVDMNCDSNAGLQAFRPKSGRSWLNCVHTLVAEPIARFELWCWKGHPAAM